MIDNFIEQNKDKLIEMVIGALKIRSVEETPEESAPFGKGVKEALLYALDKGKELGFKTVNIDNVLGYVEFGEGSETISILGHLDVVPEGTDWKYPPYGGEIHEGKIFGRGAIDDKGPIMAVLFGLFAIKEKGMKLSKKIRVIFGTNEETGWKCMNHLKTIIKEPLVGFTPDADFPVINREKGILDVTLRREFLHKNKDVIIRGGERPNMVPDYAEAKFQRKINLKFDSGDIHADGNTVCAKGISAHGAKPEKGKNAISLLMKSIYNVDFNKEVKDLVKFVREMVREEVDGKSLGIKMSDEPSGDLTANLGLMEINEDFGELTFNIRYPITKNFQDIVSKIDAASSKYGLTVSKVKNQNPLFVKEDEPLLKTLLRVYEEFTGSKGYTIGTGGGTYARAMDMGVAFGPSMPGMEAVEHMANEYIEVEFLVKLAQLYSNAIYELAK